MTYWSCFETQLKYHYLCFCSEKIGSLFTSFYCNWIMICSIYWQIFFDILILMFQNYHFFYIYIQTNPSRTWSLLRPLLVSQMFRIIVVQCLGSGKQCCSSLVKTQKKSVQFTEVLRHPSGGIIKGLKLAHASICPRSMPHKIIFIQV